MRESLTHEVLDKSLGDLLNLVDGGAGVDGLRDEREESTWLLDLWSDESEHILMVLREDHCESTDQSSHKTHELYLQ